MATKRLILWICSSLILVYLILLATSSLYFHLEQSWNRYRWRGQDTTTTEQPLCTLSDHYWDGSDDGLIIPGDNKQWRVRFGDGPGASVRGWPSKGGHYALYSCLTVELNFLGLDRFQEADRPHNVSTTDEEAHCKRMRQLGARWWASADEEATWWFVNPEENWALNKPMKYFGWPAQGGVWVLNTTLIGASEMGTGRIHIAITMEERCRIMEDLGATYYADPEDCPLLDLSDKIVSGE